MIELVQSTPILHRGGRGFESLPTQGRNRSAPTKLKPPYAAFFMACTYILFSRTLDGYYIGSTETNPEDRLKKHLSNHSGYTGKAKDWVIVYHEELETKEAARQRELFIKGWKSKILMEKLIGKSK